MSTADKLNVVSGVKGFVSMPLAERMETKIERSDGLSCWHWRGARSSGGYGQIWVDGKLRPAHRVMYELKVAQVPEDLVIDHLCRVRHCVNPDHMEVVSQEENIRRGEGGKNYRDKTHCPQGHPYAGDNLYTAPSGNRLCRKCQRRHQRAFRKRARLERAA